MKGTAIPQTFGRGLGGIFQPSGEGNRTLLASLLDDSAARAFNILRVAASVVDQETVVIGNAKFRVEELNTAITGLTAIQLTAANTGTLTATSKTIFLVGATQKFVAGDVILAGTEFLLITGVLSDGSYSIYRGYAGSTAATHAANATMKMAATPGVSVAAGYLLVPFTSALTNTLLPTRLAWIIEHFSEALLQSGFVGGATPLDVSDARNLTAVVAASGILLVAAGRRGNFTLACSETLSGSGNAWDAAAFHGGNDPLRSRVAALQRVPLAAEVSEGKLYIPHDFPANPSAFIVQILVTSGLAVLAWDGGITLVPPVTGLAVLDVQTIALNNGGTPTVGTFVLHITDPNTGTVYNTAPISVLANNTQVENAILEAIGEWDLGPDVTVTGGPGPSVGLVVTFAYRHGGRFEGLITAMTTTDTGFDQGASSSVTHTTSGVAAVPASPGYLVLDNGGATDWAATNTVNVVLFE